MLRFKEGEQAIYAIPERVCEQQFVGTRVTVTHVGPFHAGQTVGNGTATGSFDYGIDIRMVTSWGQPFMVGVKDWQLTKISDPDADVVTEQDEELCIPS